MHPETVKPIPSSEGDKKKNLDREIRDMVNAITHRVTDLRQRSEDGGDEDDHGVRIITLAGNNTGATMRSELDDKSKNPHENSFDEPEALGTYVNSNFQAVNNSIMMGSTYNTNDPGVHMDIVDTFDHHGNKAEKHGKKGKRKEKEAHRSEQQSENHSD